jgi:branched-chain amino acid transport system permease protein
MDYLIHLVILVGMYLILAQAFNLTFGLGYLFNLAHVASYAIGAYVTALLATELGVSFFPCIAASMVVSGLFALLIGAISLKLTQDYFAIGTLAFSSVVSALLINWKSLTRGVLGIPGIPRPELIPVGLCEGGGNLERMPYLLGFLLERAHINPCPQLAEAASHGPAARLVYYLLENGQVDFYNNRNFLVLMAVTVFAAELVLYMVFRGPFARSLRAQAEFEHAAMGLGKNTRQVRNISFFVASMFAGLAGAFFAYYINYIDPSSFSLSEMIFVLTICVVGRPGSFWGCIFGTAFLVLLPEPLRFTGEVQGWLESLFGLASGASLDVFGLNWLVQFFNFVSQPSVLGPMRQMIYAVLLFAVVFINRSKLFPVERTV